MATPTHKAPGMAKFLEDEFGRTTAIVGDKCVFGNPNHDASTFRDALSEREYRISGMCQACQDSVFGGGDDNE